MATAGNTHTTSYKYVPLSFKSVPAAPYFVVLCYAIGSASSNVQDWIVSKNHINPQWCCLDYWLRHAPVWMSTWKLTAGEMAIHVVMHHTIWVVRLRCSQKDILQSGEKSQDHWNQCPKRSTPKRFHAQAALWGRLVNMQISYNPSNLLA